MTESATSMLMYLLVAVGSLPTLCTGFSPDFAFKFAVLSIDSMDHQEITEAGALTVLKDYLLDNPNTEFDSTTVINSLQSPSARSLLGAYYHGTPNCSQARCDLHHRYYTQALESILAANSDTDSAETGIPRAHFDNEAIPQGNNRLQEKRQIIISSIRMGSYEKARLETGLALHTLQDFYSHSNWVELDNTEPLEDLGQPTYTPSNVASPSTPTCTDCEQGRNVSAQELVFTAALAQFRHEYDCVDNIRSDIISNKVLLSGYSGRAPDGEKPDGKCSHAGVIDYTATLKPIGGINKDFRSNVWSPHFDLHDQAASVAIKATAVFLQDIREAVGDEEFGTFLNIDSARSSVAFVIDTSGSAAYYQSLQAALPRIQEGIERYQGSTEGAFVLDYVLVPLSTPNQGTVNITDNFTVLRESIEGLPMSSEGAEDCMEPSIGAIIRAATNSKTGGVINIFTDGQPNDIQRLPEAMAIIRTKNVKVNIFYIVGCTVARRRRRRLVANQVYERLAFISGGHILEVPAEDVASIDAIVLTTIRPSAATLFQQQAGSDFSSALQFQVDSTVSTVLITVNGNNLQIEGVLSPQGEDVSGQTILQVHLSSSSSYLATITVPPNDTYYGTWSLSFNSSSYYRALITGDSSLIFSYTLYRTNGEIKERALPGEALLPSVKVDREAERAAITAGSIVSSAGATLIPLSLTSDEATGNYLAVTGTPPVPFALRMAGTDSRGFPFTRTIGNGVDVSDIRIGLRTGQSPFQVLRSGDERTLSLVLSNQGEAATLTVQVLTNDISSTGFAVSFKGNTTSNIISLTSGGTTNLNLQITAQKNIDETNSLFLIVVVYDQSSIITRSNYFNIELVGTTVPLVDLSQIEFYNAQKKLGGGALNHMALIVIVLLITMYIN